MRNGGRGKYSEVRVNIPLSRVRSASKKIDELKFSAGVGKEVAIEQGDREHLMFYKGLITGHQEALKELRKIEDDYLSVGQKKTIK